MHPQFPRLSVPLSCFPSNSPTLLKSGVHPLCSHTQARDWSWRKAHSFRISVVSVSTGRATATNNPQSSGAYTFKAHFLLTGNSPCSTASRRVILRHSAFTAASTVTEPPLLRHGQSRGREQRRPGEHPLSHEASASKRHTSLPSYFADQHKSYGQD